MQIEKNNILKDNKAGVYCLINKVKNKIYIGSSLNLRVRFWVYYSDSRIRKANMIIYKALLKYGYENFRVLILEYCNGDPQFILEREQYFINTLNPKYNILSKSGSSFGYRHTE